jgi:hypothetical protein
MMSAEQNGQLRADRLPSGMAAHAEEFEQSDLHQNAVMRPLEIIGEAARRVSRQTRDAHPEIPGSPAGR